ncbi:serine hydrolase domain-containing protein [Rurimicrobium arvi]|uniref:Serine hydrolase domain-containing protein n=1 Tax=Rurimicrobium arvi TaxID=2049916 RepID=A0ABP8MRM0_9BACT
MIILKRTVFLSVVLSIVIIACQSGREKVNARPSLGLPPIEMGAIQLSYSDTNSPEWKVIARRLDSFYRIQERAGFNGSVLVGYQGKILYEKYIGYSNKRENIPLSSDNAVQLASTSKTFTGAAILYLHQNKYLDIDHPVAQYIKDFPYPDITVRMLLNHRSGLPDYGHFVPLYRKSKDFISNDEVLRIMAQHKPHQEFKTNTRFKYCNTNYLILASIIEEVTEMSFDAFMQQYIFKPLGMTHTFVYTADKQLPSSATISYQGGYVPFPLDFRDGVYGDKNIYSTVEDMYRWDQSFYSNKFLSNETLELAYGPCSFERPGIKNYGLGWRMLCYPDGYKIIYHNGWWHGNNTCFYRFIKDNFTIIVLGNKHSNAIYRQPPVVYNLIKNTEAVGQFDDGAE